ncbi:MAG: nucleoside triphosphate pyrophosphohydrolase family protein [Patescibacteria group bacterium UBA2163]
MDFNDYQTKASSTNTQTEKGAQFMLMYLSMGLAGESGEVVEKLKKVVRNDDGVVTDEKREDLKKELGDVLWYLSQFADALGISFDDVAEANIAKLADRAKRDVIKSEGDNR